MIYVFLTITTMIVILGLAAVGGSLAERSGIINLSIEGFMTIGAISYSLFAGTHSLNLNLFHQIWLMPIAGLIAGIFSLFYGVITVRWKANQTIAGIALNSLALAISLFLIHSKINPGGAGDKIQIQAGLLSFGNPGTATIGSIFNIVLLMGLPLIGLIIVLLNRTKLGIKIKAVGEEPHAAASLGIKVERTQMIAVFLAGFFSGIAGGLFAQMRGAYFFGSTQGIGFLAVALVIFGQWRPSIIFAGSILFGILYGGVLEHSKISFISTIQNPEILNIVPYAISLFVLIFTSKNSRAPKYVGIPYKNAGR